MTTKRAPLSSNFSELLGIESVEADLKGVVFRMPVVSRLANRNGVLHGGALMSLVDHAAGTLAFLNSPSGFTNVTVEAKTNFFRSVRVDDTLTAIGKVLHVGRSTLVVLVTTSRQDGKELSATIQTHLFVEWRDDAGHHDNYGTAARLGDI